MSSSWGEPPVAQTSGSISWLPSAGGALGQGWKVLWPNFGPLLLVEVVFLVLIILPSLILGKIAGILGSLYALFVIAPLSLGFVYACVETVRGNQPQVSHLFRSFSSGQHYLSIIGAIILWYIAVAVGYVLLVIPGIWISTRLSLLPYVMADRGVGGMQAIQMTWQLTRGRFWSLFGLSLLGMVIYFVGMLIIIVGVIPAILWVTLAFSAYYAALAEQAGLSTSTSVLTQA